MQHLVSLFMYVKSCVLVPNKPVALFRGSLFVSEVDSIRVGAMKCMHLYASDSEVPCAACLQIRLCIPSGSCDMSACRRLEFLRKQASLLATGSRCWMQCDT
jgi:hypothetical protein